MNFIRSTYSPVAQMVAATAIFALVLSLVYGAVPFVSAQGNPNEEYPNNPNITVCHAEGNAKDPYTQNTIDASSIINKPNGHNFHNDKGLDDKGDIIPPFEYDFGNGTQQYPGKNWTTVYSNTLTGEQVYNNGGCNGTPAPKIDLSIEKTVNISSPDEGTQVVFTLEVTNAGPDTATNVVVSDTLPAGLTFVSSIPAPVNPATTPLTWDLGSLSSGESTSIALTVMVSGDQGGNQITNTGSVIGDETDTNSNNNSESETITVIDIPEVKGCTDEDANNYNPLATVDDGSCDYSATLTVIKNVLNDDQTADKVAGDFTITVTGTNVSDTSFAGSETGTVVTLDAGAFSVEEGAHDGYAVNYSTDCSGTIEAGDEKICTITNDDLDPTMGTITIVKTVINDDEGTAAPGDFTFRIDGTVVAVNSEVQVTPGLHTVSEDSFAGYTAGSWGDSCASNGTVTVEAGKDYICTITNNDDEVVVPKGSITIDKAVTGKGANANKKFDFGSFLPQAFQLSANDAPLMIDDLDAGSYTFTENNLPSDWDLTSVVCGTTEMTITNDSVTLSLAQGEDVTCVFTNTFDDGNDPDPEEPTYLIDGFKWSDLVADGVWDTVGDDAEPALAGWTIEVTNGVDTFSTTTDSTGYYWFEVEAGDWTVSEVQQLQWTQTWPTPVGDATEGVCRATLGEPIGTALVADDVADSVSNTVTELECNFGNHQSDIPEDTYILEGYVWHDANENDVWDQGEEVSEESLNQSTPESALGGWEVKATNGTVTLTTTTNSNGYYSFEVTAGTWTITETLQSEWELTYPNTGTHTVTVPQIVQATPQSFFASVMSTLIPTAHAAVIGTYGQFNFGNVFKGCTSNCGGGGGGGSSSSGSKKRSTNNDEPVPEVLGEATSVLPIGAPNTGAGGATASPIASLLSFFGMLMSLVTLRLSKNG